MRSQAKIPSLFIVLFGLTGARAGLFRPADASTSNEPHILVRIADATDGNPIHGATVSATRFDFAEVAVSVASDEDGKATLVGLRANTPYLVRVQSSGYVALTATVIPVIGAEAEPLTVQLAEERTERIKIICRGPIVNLDTRQFSTGFDGEFLAKLPGGVGTYKTPRPECEPVRRKQKRKAKS